MSYKFAPARPEETIVYGAARPSHPRISQDDVNGWIAFMTNQGIKRVCCLLDTELEEYDDLLETYSREFGSSNVCHVPIKDFTVIDHERFYSMVLPFLQVSALNDDPVVVHCSAGSGRTGQILCLWLVCARGYSLSDAIQTIRETGRNPLEAAADSDLAAVLAAGWG